MAITIIEGLNNPDFREDFENFAVAMLKVRQGETLVGRLKQSKQLDRNNPQHIDLLRRLEKQKENADLAYSDLLGLGLPPNMILEED